MKELVEVIAKALVDNPSEVVVSEKKDGKNTIVELHVAQSDMGKVIGKQGKIAKAMSTIVHSATPRNSKRYVIEIREQGGDAVDLGEENEENAD